MEYSTEIEVVNAFGAKKAKTETITKNGKHTYTHTQWIEEIKSTYKTFLPMIG